MPNVTRSKVQMILDSWDEKTKARFIELYNLHTPHKEIALELNFADTYVVGYIAKALNLELHKKGKHPKAKYKPPTSTIPHNWEVNCRRRTCTVCGLTQYKSTKFCLNNPTHLTWLPKSFTCTSSKA